MENINVLVVSPQSFFRRGIEYSLADVEGITLSGIAEIDDTTLAEIDADPPDVTILDIDSSGGNGLLMARKIKQRFSGTGIVVLTSNYNDAQLFQSLKAQAAAYLNKEITTEDLVHVMKRVANGEHPINDSLTARPRVAEQVLEQFQKLSWQAEAEALISPLTARETEILRYIAQGYLNKQIAMELGISEQTIKNHVTSILRKLNANVRTEAVVVAIKQGLITLE